MSDRPLHVALWSPVPPPIGGVARWTLRYRAHAPRFGLRLSIIDISPGETKTFTEKSTLRADRVGPALRAWSLLARLLATDRPDVAHLTTTLFWATPRDAAALLLCRARKVPTILHIRASNQIIAWREAMSRPQRTLVDASLRLASCVLVLSEELETYLRREVKGLRVARIGNMIDVLPDDEAPGLAPVLPPRRGFRVLFVGACTPLKGVAELAEAVAVLDGVELVLVGDGGGAIDHAQHERMTVALDRLKALGRLVQTGGLAPDVAARAYREADAFCLPSHREGLPNVLLEAMAAGLPCVVTLVGAVTDVVGDDGALTVPVDAAAELATALGRLRDDPALRRSLGARARAIVAERYSIEAVITGYRHLYEELIADNGRTC